MWKWRRAGFPGGGGGIGTLQYCPEEWSFPRRLSQQSFNGNVQKQDQKSPGVFGETELCLKGVIRSVCRYVHTNTCSYRYFLVWGDDNQQTVCFADMRTYAPTLQLGTVPCASDPNTEEAETESFLGLAGQLVWNDQ